MEHDVDHGDCPRVTRREADERAQGGEKPPQPAAQDTQATGRKTTVVLQLTPFSLERRNPLFGAATCSRSTLGFKKRWPMPLDLSEGRKGTNVSWAGNLHLASHPWAAMCRATRNTGGSQHDPSAGSGPKEASSRSARRTNDNGAFVRPCGKPSYGESCKNGVMHNAAARSASRCRTAGSW